MVRLLSLALLAACTAPNWLQPYKVEVQQGNFVTQEMIAKLKPGMTKSQVRFALGTPLLADPFHKDRWDYVFSLSAGGDLIQKRMVTVVFVDDKLQRVEGDVVAATSEPGGQVSKLPEEQPATRTEPKEEKGFFGKILESIGL
jgi:outer membrane protein assembly factor BamE